jgi:hypothetical protein
VRGEPVEFERRGLGVDCILIFNSGYLVSFLYNLAGYFIWLVAFIVS